MTEFDLWFLNLKMKNSIKVHLLKEYKEAENIWHALKNNECDVIKLPSGAMETGYEDEILHKKMQYENMKFSYFGSSEYPRALKPIDEPPYVLFYRGCLSKLNEGINVSVVGSRKCTHYGENCTREITKFLSRRNVNIISGMAYGIDSLAHGEALENNAFTCAVLGSGVDVVYPKSNYRLYERICNEGCVLSEFLPGTKPLNYNFPRRNRIISGLSRLVIVVEASERSGSLITSTLALEQGKDVMAVPGSVFSSYSRGTNKLIKDGAYPFTELDDLCQLLNLKSNVIISNNDSKLTEEEENILKVITDSPIHIDDIVRSTHVDMKQLYGLLFELQLKKLILSLAGNYYVKVFNAI